MSKTLKKELLIFVAVAFGVTYLMGIPLGIVQRAGYDGSVFGDAQMFYPAAGVMLALWLTSKQDLPKRFFAFYLFSTAVCIALCFANVFAPENDWLTVVSLFVTAASVLAWVFLLTEKKEKREAWGLRWHGSIWTACGLVVKLIVLRLGMAVFSMAISDEAATYLSYWMSATPWIVLAMLIPNFLLTFLPFFGEEYGWRYYLQPKLQQRFGKRRGVLILGVVWGLWHLPLNLFYYSPDTSLQSIVVQIFLCIALGVFFGYAYGKTQNIWVPTMLHYFFNNLVVVIIGTADISNQVYTWADVGIAVVMYIVCYLPFLASKVFDEPVKVESKSGIEAE